MLLWLNKGLSVWYNITWKGGDTVGDEMTREELISLTIDKYTDLQRIKKSNGKTENKELEYQLKVTVAKLSSLEISVEDITL